MEKSNCYKKILLQLLTMTVLINLIPAHCIAQLPNPLSFNTAVNANNTGVITIGQNDLSWTASMTFSTGPYFPAVAVQNFGWLVPPTNKAEWISYPHNCSSSPAEHSCLGNVDEFYKLTFNLPATTCTGSISDPGGYCLGINFFADNWVHEIFVNGISSYYNPNLNAYNAYGFAAVGGASVTLCNNWQPGANELIVHVKSGAPTYPGWTGFLAFVNPATTTTVLGNFTAQITQTNISCFGFNDGSASVSLTPNGTYNYTWTPFGGNSSSASTLPPGIYTVVVSKNNYSCTTTNTFSITEPAPFTISVTSTPPRCKGATLTFTASGATTYSWLPVNTGGQTLAVTPTITTSYTVVGFDTTGCPSSIRFTQTVLTCTGLDEMNEAGLRIFPNPANTSITITGLQGQSLIELYNMNSELILIDKPFQNNYSISTAELHEGIYFLKISGVNSSFTRKLIVCKE